jgi:hypothetical protein
MSRLLNICDGFELAFMGFELILAAPTFAKGANQKNPTREFVKSFAMSIPFCI